MLRHSEASQACKISQILYLTLFLFHTSLQLSVTLSVPNAYSNSSDIMLMNNTGNNSINDDLYVIKAVVYEIGILTDANNATNDTTERQEEIKLSFYNPPTSSNES